MSSVQQKERVVAVHMEEYVAGIQDIWQEEHTYNPEQNILYSQATVHLLSSTERLRREA